MPVEEDRGRGHEQPRKRDQATSKGSIDLSRLTWFVFLVLLFPCVLFPFFCSCVRVFSQFLFACCECVSVCSRVLFCLRLPRSVGLSSCLNLTAAGQSRSEAGTDRGTGSTGRHRAPQQRHTTAGTQEQRNTHKHRAQCCVCSIGLLLRSTFLRPALLCLCPTAGRVNLFFSLPSGTATTPSTQLKGKAQTGSNLTPFSFPPCPLCLSECLLPPPLLASQAGRLSQAPSCRCCRHRCSSKCSSRCSRSHSDPSSRTGMERRQRQCSMWRWS